MNLRRAFAEGANPGNPPEISAWIGRQRAQGGTNEAGGIAQPYNCCGQKDVHILGADEGRWRKATEEQARSGIRYEVSIENKWYPIRDYQLVQNPLEDPNPIGEAVLYYGYNGTQPGGVSIYCFSPWEADG